MNRVEAFKSALLNTCLRIAKAAGMHLDISLSTCKADKVFCMGAYKCLSLPFFQPPIEQAMSVALGELRNDLWMVVNTK